MRAAEEHVHWTQRKHSHRPQKAALLAAFNRASKPLPSKIASRLINLQLHTQNCKTPTIRQKQPAGEHWLGRLCMQQIKPQATTYTNEVQLQHNWQNGRRHNPCTSASTTHKGHAWSTPLSISGAVACWGAQLPMPLGCATNQSGTVTDNHNTSQTSTEQRRPEPQHSTC